MSKGRSGSASDLVRRLGRGEIALTHEAFRAFQPWRAAARLCGRTGVAQGHGSGGPGADRVSDAEDGRGG